MKETTSIPAIPPVAAWSDADGDPDAGVLVPMLRPPRRIAGRSDPAFSPAALYALTRVERTDIDVSDEDLWMVERSLKAVHPRGIEVAGMWWTGAGLDRIVTGKKGSPRRDLVVRYDAALLARGVLEEVRVLEKTDTGYVERARCEPEEQYHARVDSATVIREREAYLREIQAKASRNRHARITLARGEEALRELEAAEVARVRLQKKKTDKEPIAAAPIRDRDPHNEQSALAAVLRDRSAAYSQEASRPEESPATSPGGGPQNDGAIPDDSASTDERESGGRHVTRATGQKPTSPSGNGGYALGELLERRGGLGPGQQTG